ncbi:TRAP transporter large permease subunit [Sporolituus thermophilus]|uniref:TRAP transporter, DctM subunit n=1 Tax=Sporolituus thermophilus DSM 23256 TaxID=1123285 RepID=A0A1G7LA99_9FIRM|nr:TRAP transporter large permease subunit [Sporolituus thermophilus]SDF46301.1 TRAP transporter, DctM subunit [Sporolituus thermophilus DSM 23256]
MTVAIFLFSICGAMALGMPIAFALLVCGVALMLHLGMFDTRILAQNLIIGADNFALMAIPFFILVGELMNAGGISKKIINFGIALVGHIRGGLGYVAIITAFIFAGLSGSAVADTAALAAIMVPMMAEAGYVKSRSAALIGAGSIVAPILPPSIPFIIFASISGLSVMKLFMAGIVPGVMVAVSLAVLWWYMARRMNVKVYPRRSLKEIAIAIKDAAWALALPFIIMIGIKFGIVTPTEASVVAVFYTLFLCFVVYRSITIRDLYHILISAAKTTSVIMFLIAAAMVSSWLIAIANIPAMVTSWLAPYMGNQVLLLVAINILVFIVGTAMDLTPTVLILTPVLMPIIKKAGIDPIYFGVVFILNNAIGLLTPPVGTVLNAACGAGKVLMDDLMKDIMPFLLIETVVLILLILFPQIVLVPLKWMGV